MDEGWEEHAKIWDRDEHSRFFADRALEALIEPVKLANPAWRGRRVLDFGSGTGLLTERLAPRVGEVVALDISEPMLEVLRAKSLDNVTIRRADIDRPGAGPPSWLCGFDLVVASCVCDALRDYEAAVALLAHALNPGGMLAQWDWLAESDGQDDGLTLERVRAALEQAGLRILGVEPCFSVAFGAENVPVLMGLGVKDA